MEKGDSHVIMAPRIPADAHGAQSVFSLLVREGAHVAILCEAGVLRVQILSVPDLILVCLYPACTLKAATLKRLGAARAVEIYAHKESARQA